MKVLYKDKIYEGLSVQIVVPEGEYQGRYKTRVEEVGQKIITIGVPVVDGQFIPLREGTALEVVFVDDLSAYSFSTVLIKRFSVPIPTFIIEFPEKIFKVQRRKYVRIQVVSPLQYRTVEKEGLGIEQKGFMHDLSGGGLLFQTKGCVPEKTLVVVEPVIGDTAMQIPAIVVRCVKEEEKNAFLVSAEFYEISERMRDKIISYVFELQREMRKKGLV
ncbi:MULTISPECIES: flagellar brake domain-containing protein [Dehalobacter]|uniref:flagellar brake protein n=1 Tax=Dehalobacter TaxID=56112 RepID=UPI001FA772A4|nr:MULTISPECIES: flagellar brake domain-containing protein [Dehalobacter]MDJ0305986.1 flagellar brake domain-containing protein [Dehalobacter sp.]